MTDKALYILAGYDDETEKYLAGIQKKLYEQGFTGVHTKNIPQHITMGSFPAEMENELTALLKKLSEEETAFEVTFNHVGIFGGGKVLFIAPDANEQMLRIKERFGSSDNWTPHTTMLIDTPDMTLKAIPVVLSEFSSFRGRITTLYLYEFWPTRHILTVKLTAAEG